MALPIRRHNNAPESFSVGNDPFSELERLHEQLSQYLHLRQPLTGLLSDVFTPAADIEETDDAYVVDIELPGVKRDDLDIEVSGRRVSVRGERKEKERVGILRRRERTVGRFAYEVTLPGDVAEDGIEAHLTEGVLNIRLPKAAHDLPRRIAIN